jgi:hypothetical protein
MSRNANTVWELRAAGADTNGGGFVTGASGTDWSQQDTPQYSVTDGVTAGSTTITSATAAFGTDVVGNILFVSGGTGSVVGDWYEIVSRTNATTIVVDRATGLTAGTGVTLKIGGALATWAKLWALMSAGNNSYVKGSFTITTAVLISFSAGVATGSFGSLVQGYTTTRGDTGQATLTTATNSIDLIAFTLTYGILFKNLLFSSTAGTRGDGIKAKSGNNTAAIGFDRCTFDGFSRHIVGNFSVDWMFVSLMLRNCELKNAVSDGGRNSGFTSMVGCYIHNNGGVGWRHASGGASAGLCVESCIFKSNTSDGLLLDSSDAPTASSSGAATIRNCAFTDNGAAGLNRDVNANGVLLLENNIYYANTTFGWTSTSAATLLMGGTNAFGANTTAARGANAVALPGDISLSADPFTNRAGGDFSLSTGSAGAACNAAGFPGVLLGGGTGYESIGPLPPITNAVAPSLVITKNVTLFLGDPGDFQ